MIFSTDFGKKVSLFVTDPREDLTETEIKAAMDIIVQKNIFEPGGENLKTPVEAKLVQTETTEYDLVVA
ncbi:DUF2922 domain-containing protein [Romboutsia sedimentorum]|uniref:DUF2922 domain-containing protein n=1 Tax=Romboutsia sedimentorum TaxID=1368474 RepID=UPI0024DE2088|nr:DUF2922 domain-containing protein [Romboutsia sedimentorum]MDK2586813.1 DUF2922 domain-containing protein [Romboutsia sedimentorum]